MNSLSRNVRKAAHVLRRGFVVLSISVLGLCCGVVLRTVFGAQTAAADTPACNNMICDIIISEGHWHCDFNWLTSCHLYAGGGECGTEDECYL